MAVLNTLSPTSTMFQQFDNPTHTAPLLGAQLSQPIAGSSRGSSSGQSTVRPLVDLESGQASSQNNNESDNRPVNGQTARHVASSEPSHEFEPQNIPRARTEKHQSLAQRPKASMTRSKTNYEPENMSSTREPSVEEHGELRHGWEDEYNSSEFLGQLNSVHLHKRISYIYRV